MKQEAKKIIAKFFSDINYPIVINSYGRSGSTVLTKSIIESLSKEKKLNVKNFISRSISDVAWSLREKELKNGMVYKTHDYPPEQKINCRAKFIYIYANPVDVVLSLLRLFDALGEEWMKEHYEHLNAMYGDFEKIIYEDQLGLERHFDAWFGETRFQIALVKYEKLWYYQNELSKFLGLSIQLPKFKERKTKDYKDSNIAKTIKQSYQSLIEKVNKLDGLIIKNTNVK